MFLAMDVGNTQICIGVFLKGKLSTTWRLNTRPFATADELKLKVNGLLHMVGIETLETPPIIVSSVVPAVTTALKRGFDSERLFVVDHTWKFSFQNKADIPESVGQDRLVNAEAVVRQHEGAALIVDSGTATTLCAVSAQKEYLGGAIMPGMEMASEALFAKAAKLFSIEIIPPTHAIGKNTEQALRSGIVLGYATMIDGMVKRFKKEMGEPNAKVFATGGVSEILKGVSEEFNVIDRDLTLKGLGELYESVRK